MRADTKIKVWGAVFSTALILLMAGRVGLADEYKIAEIDDLSPDEMQVTAFALKQDARVHLQAVGGKHKRSERMFAYAWLLDAETRQLVWSMTDEFTHSYEGSDYLREFDDEIELAQGVYELYCYAGRPRYFGNKIQIEGLGDLQELIKDLVGGKDRPSDEDLAGECFVRAFTESAVYEVSGHSPGLPRGRIDLGRPDNEAYLQEAFVLTTPTELDIYAVGEYSVWSEVMVDWGWIINVKTRERVWEMDRWNSEWAGGADKNRMSREQITLPKGGYIAYYVTDGSHTYDDWNEMPPYDPDAWGLRIWAAGATGATGATDEDAITVTAIDHGETAVIELTGVCNNEFLSEGFELTAPADVHIYAIGEDDRYSDGLADYAWIAESESGERIWVMEDDNTTYAGGAAKNRMFDGVITLEPAKYVIHYVSDGSHSYCSWNTSPPYDQKAYGITISLAPELAERDVFVRFKPTDEPTGALAAITCVRNNERRRERFSLNKVTRVRIHAVGEGDSDDMYDYGWIENADDGDIVWEMTYRKTVHAGGAKKNRLVHQKILLDKGNYVAYFVSDGSHSCNDWNAGAPDDPFSWGMIITEIE